MTDRLATALDVCGYMSPIEMGWLHARARALNPGARWVEIGSWQGRSATAVAAALPERSELILVDNFSGPTTREMPNRDACRARLEAAMSRMREINSTLTVWLLEGDSAELHREIDDRSVDVIFIDGDHALDAVVADLRGWTPKIRDGGLLCGHDYGNQCGVEPAVEKLCPGFSVVPETTIWFLEVMR